MTPPKVSICIPTYKQTTYLRRTLESIAAQEYKDYEIIITDDSPDESVAGLVSEFNFKDKIKYFKNKNKLGTPENWNESIRHAKGEYIKILHHDDHFSDESSLSKYVKMLDENPNTDFAFSASKMYDKNGKVTSMHGSNQEKLNNLSRDIGSLFNGNFIGAPSAAIHKRTSIQYDKNLKWLVDIDFYMALLKKNPHFVFTEEPLVVISSESDDKVTNECVNDKCVLFREYLYVYKKNNANGIKIRISSYLRIFWDIIRRHDIQGEQDLASCGLLNKLPFQLRILMMVQKIIKRYGFIVKIKRKIIGIKNK